MKKILAVDDCSTIRVFLRKLGRDWQMELIDVESGKEALAIMEQPDSPQILLVDLMMPEMDGLELIRRIRQMKSRTPRYIIVMTAKTGFEGVEEAFEAGADDFLSKPLDREELKVRIAEATRVLERDESISKALSQIQRGRQSVKLQPSQN